MTQNAEGTGKPTRTRKAPAAAEPAEAAAAPKRTRRPAAAKSGQTAAARKAAAEATVADATTGEVEVQFERDGDDVVLTVGGKKRSLDEVDDSQFVEAVEAPLVKELVEEEQGFALSDSDDADEPEVQVVSAGATADPVKDYLKHIG